MQYQTVFETTSVYFETALDAALKLCRDAIWDGDRCNWIGANVAPAGGRYQVVRNSCGPGVYTGLAGIALFLGRMSTHVNEPILEVTLDGCVESVLQTKWPEESSNYAYFGGKLGVGDALVQLGELKNREEWTKAGEELLAFGSKVSQTNNEAR